jgi:hypothetical protein
MKTNYNLGDKVRLTDSRGRKFLGTITGFQNEFVIVTFSNRKWKIAERAQIEYINPFRFWFIRTFPNRAERIQLLIVLTLVGVALVAAGVKTLMQ